MPEAFAIRPRCARIADLAGEATEWRCSSVKTTISDPTSRTRALSVTAVENDFVERVYEKLANVYDLIFGPTLHPGRLVAIERMGIQPGDRVLEVGVGTGINTSLYPRNCQVTGIDLSASMLEKARERVAREGLRNVRLLEMDAAQPDLRRRLVRHRLRAVPGQRRARSGQGRARDAPRLPAGRQDHHPESLPQREPDPVALERAISPFTVHIGFKSDLDLPGFLAQAELQPMSIEKVNVPRIWSLVTCIK